MNLLVDSLAAKLLQLGQPDNLGALNKAAYAITAPLPWKTTMGGLDFQDRLRASRQRLGFDSALYVQELAGPVISEKQGETHAESLLPMSTGDLEMTGRVLYQHQPMQGVLVQLRQHIPSLEEDSLTAIIGYARTNAKGEFAFTHLFRDSGYSVLPLKPGFEFGTRKGTSRLDKNAACSFVAKPHKIRLIGSIVYGQLKEDGVLIVRTPEEFKTSFQVIAGSLILAFLLYTSSCQ
ncbi:hypothetical protein [Paraflavitalea speifideaquila]|uniref:hypothetical protein n=1 Tax=Paraflavitalea speifideaquila TaxID=3076558 RepID=UPI0028E84B6E|nr:hypothetical protein [Paraflavitalea speifideiaquila]